ncbi:MAG: hypothetical protein CMJ35_14690 [Phycisphaerae bacterium]|nr:hypothetical protein [Phycisphaerae bacterium]MBM92836.1 hypothetical protein [Phycisphaerae bacterium]
MPHSPSSRIASRLPQPALDAPFRLFFGGSFDPPHLGHITLPQRVLEQIDQPQAWMIYVPAAQSPHKSQAPSPDQARLDMLETAMGDAERCLIWDTELRRAKDQPGEPSYWADTWQTVRSRCPHGLNRFLIGADQARSMHRWHQYETIWKDSIVMLRGKHDDPGQLIEALRATGAWDAHQLDHWHDAIVQVELVDASSTDIRAKLRTPETRKNPIAGLDDRVQDYILEHGLYRD